MDSDIRMIRKRFKCSNCEYKMSKLIYANNSFSSCEKCQGIMREVSEEEYQLKTRDQINNNYRIVFNEENKNKNFSRFDTNDRSKNNINGDTERKFKREENKNKSSDNNTKKRMGNQFTNSNINTESGDNYNYSNRRRNSNVSNNSNRFDNYNIYESNSNNIRTDNNRNSSGFLDNIFSNFFPIENTSNIPNNRNNQSQSNNLFSDFFSNSSLNFPFSESPFFGRINRHLFNDDIFDPEFTIFGSTFNDAFRDNFSSNFRSNYTSRDNFYELFNTIRDRNRDTKENKKTSKETLRNLKRFKMSVKYCKKNEKGEIEVPSCPICISEIIKDEETILLPCGHMFHHGCCIKWLKKNNTCPVCRFELPAEREL